MADFSFPDFRAVYNYAPKYQIQHLKFALRTLFHRRRIRAFERFVNSSAAYQHFFAALPQDAYPLLHTYIDKRFRAADRLKHMSADLATAKAAFGEDIFSRLNLRENSIVLSPLSDGLILCLNRNTNCMDEGWWAVSLRNDDNRILYSATFAFIGGRIIIASVQGPAGAEAKDQVRRLTKQLHGLRPQNLMTVALQYLAAALTGTHAAGIAHDHQVKLRWRLKKRVQMNYDSFWHLPAPTRTWSQGFIMKKVLLYKL
ncbi:DUF535 family protein [Neisseria lisongii]|uniref:DUF535 family protein n=1 Tax=Neisseria lisongii TaxID=2912188 RepID=A0AAW5AQ24_9NEIS|nr:DUF535 family protein [Neisseria lisongii]MCF7529478.1 DUF535 family protein [Neisseria lisongii]MCF7530185.1 DUF535 family protein [Neisseria lisongii]